MLTLLLFLAAAHAAPPAAELSFADAMRRAAEGTPWAQRVDAEAQAARAEARAGAAWENPELSAQTEPDQTTVALTVPLDLGALGRGATVSDAVRAADQRARAARAAVGAAGGAAWLDARRAEEIAALSAQSRALAERLAAAARARVAAGEWSADEGALAQADAAGALDQALQAEQEATHAMARLAALLGAAEDGLTLGAWPELPSPPPLDASAVPEVLSADLDARVALGQLRAERLARVPTLHLMGGYQISDQPGPTYGASIALPLFAPGVAAVRAASARADGTEAGAEIARLDAREAVRAAEAEIRVATQLAAAWEIPGLDDAIAATARRYEAGELSLPDYISRRDLAVAARQHAIDARWRLARAKLAAWELSGALPTEVAP